MSESRRRAVQNYRSRLEEKGLARFEVLGLEKDRELIRALARRMAEDQSEFSPVRVAVHHSVAPKSSPKGGILAALRRSPLVAADIDLSRAREEGRDIDL